jgi:LmbE family N-acetylglucosaminyl deacetylase
MKRREFLGFAALAASIRRIPAAEHPVVIERPVSGKPHAGRVLAAIQPHADDIPQFAAGAVLKLLDQGYTGYLINITNDDMAGSGTVGQTVLANEEDRKELVRVMGLKQGFSLNYPNHQMDGISKVELKSRLIFLIRLLKIDTIFCYDPWGHDEENPDHYVTAQCVEAACWMAGMDKDYPEHFAAGLRPHGVHEKYYFARGPQVVNRTVDITGVIERKIDAMLVNKAQGPAGNNGARLRATLAERKLRLPILGDDDATANREYVKAFLLARDEEIGKKYGLKYAEEYHYIGPPALPIEDYVKQRAVPL